MTIPSMTTVLDDDSLNPGVTLGDSVQLIVEEVFEAAGLYGTSIFNLTKFSNPLKLLSMLSIGEQLSSVLTAVDGLLISMSPLRSRFLTVNLGCFLTGF